MTMLKLYSLTTDNGEQGESASQVCLFVPLINYETYSRNHCC